MKYQKKRAFFLSIAGQASFFPTQPKEKREPSSFGNRSLESSETRVESPPQNNLKHSVATSLQLHIPEEEEQESMPPRKSSSSAAARKSEAAAAPATTAAAAAASRLSEKLSTQRTEPFKSLDPRVNEIVPPAALAALDDYKYSTIDTSIVQKYGGIHNYWNFCVSLVPYWVAPNMLTLLALFFSMSYPLLIISYEYRGVEIPNWVWLYSAFALLAYQTLDSIDGKHARRTGAKSALGELFDHGCDALFTPFCIYATARAAAMNNGQIFVFTLVSHFGLFLTMLEHFLSGSLTLGAVNGPTEGILISVAMYAATWYFGGPTELWAKPLEGGPWTVKMPKTFVDACRGFVHSEYVVATTRNDVFFNIMFVLGLLTVLGIARDIYMKLKRTDALQSFAVNLCVVLVWALFGALYRDTAYGSAGKWSIVYGSYFAFTASHLTVHRLCNLPATNPYGIMSLCIALPLIQLVLGSRCPIKVADYAAPMAVVITLSYVHYLISIWHQFARGLGVNVVTLTEKQLADSKEAELERKRKGER